MPNAPRRLTKLLVEGAFSSQPTSLAWLANQAYIDSNDTDKPVLIFVHGYLDNAASFSLLLPFLAHYRCIAIDLAGHGKSEHRSADAHYHLVDYAYDLHRLISQQGFQKVVLVGHSLGAIVSSIYAATQPACLLGFISIESAGPLSEHENLTSQQIAGAFSSRDRAYGAIKHPVSLQAIIEARCRISDLSKDQAKLILERNIAIDSNEKVLWRTDKRLRTQSAMRMTENQALNILQNINCHRALVIGSKGFDKVKRIIRERSDHYKLIPTVELEGGHHVHMDSPKQLAQFIDQQVNSLL